MEMGCSWCNSLLVQYIGKLYYQLYLTSLQVTKLILQKHCLKQIIWLAFTTKPFANKISCFQEG